MSYRKFNLSHTVSRVLEVNEHQKIFEASLSRDADQAEVLVRRHIQAARDCLLKLLEKQQS